MFISKLVRRGIAGLLCLALCMSLSLPVLAADSSTVSLRLSDASLVVSDAEQSVTLNIVTSEAVSVDSLMYTIEVPSGWSVAQPTMPDGISGVTWTNNQLVWYSTSTDVSDLNNLGAVAITIPANTVAGEYEIKVTGFDASANANYWVEQASYTTTLTITEAASTDPYTANITTTATEFTVNDTVAVTVNVGGTTGSFASSELTLTYDSTYLTFDQTNSNLNGAGVDLTTAGTIKLVDHGETNAYPAAYVLNFTAKAATTAATAVTLTDARFSTAANAVSADLIEATGENALSLTIKNADLTVDLTNASAVTGESTVPYGESYTFTAKNNTTYMYYDYEVSATMGGTPVDAANIVNNNNGTWTIENVTGNLVITVTETPKSYTVTVTGDSTVTSDEIANVTTTGVINGEATYNTAVTYTLPAGQAATDTVDGWHYIATVTVGGTSFTASASDLTYTIAGDKVTGDIVITLSKMVDPADSVKVTISGSNEIQKDGQTVTEFTATKNSEVTLTLVPEAGYTYVINDGTKDLTINDDNTFTVTVGESPVIITVTKTLDTTSVKVQQYLTLNETNMWLVIINGNTDADNGGTKGEISGKTYTYDGMHMLWSTKYDAYCYLVVAETLTVDDAKEKIGSALVEANAVDVEYNMDVNNTSGKVDANDAQLVYNMYQTKAYDGFDTVDMIKFLEADLNNSVGVDSTDATVIVNFLLNKTT